MVGAVVSEDDCTVKALFKLPLAPLSVLVIVIVRIPTAAEAPILTRAVRLVSLVRVVDSTVIPLPLKLTIWLGGKFCPVITTSRAVFPCVPALGETEVITGVSEVEVLLELIKNTPSPVPTPPSGLVAVIVQTPVGVEIPIVKDPVKLCSLLYVPEFFMMPEDEKANSTPFCK